MRKETDSYGNICYYNDLNQYHREDGPAIEFADGSKSWYLNNQLHREDGPAIEYADGTKFWYLNDQLHREDGPAIEYADGISIGISEANILTAKLTKSFYN